MRAHEFLPQFETPRRATAAQLGWGARARRARAVREGRRRRRPPRAGRRRASTRRLAQIGSADAWVGTLAFAGQIFCDFAGYSTCAIGVGAVPRLLRCPRTFASRTPRSGSPSSGGAGTSRCRAGCATTSTSRSAATAAGAAAHVHQPDADDADRRPVARRVVDVRRVGRAARRVPRRRARRDAARVPASPLWETQFARALVARARDVRARVLRVGVLPRAQLSTRRSGSAPRCSAPARAPSHRRCSRWRRDPGRGCSSLSLARCAARRSRQSSSARPGRLVRCTVLATLVVSLLLFPGIDRAFIYFQF